MRRVLPALLVIVAATALSACTAPIPGPTADPEPTTASPSPTPEPEPTRPALAELVLSPDGVGPIRLGEPVPTTAAELSPVTWDPERCGEPGYPADGRWLSVEADAGGAPAFWVVTVDPRDAGSPVSQIGIGSPDIRSGSGIGIGSTLDELLAAEPGAELIAGDPADAYVVRGERGAVGYEVARADTSYWSPEQVGRVVLIWLDAPTSTVGVGPRSASGAAGVCFT